MTNWIIVNQSWLFSAIISLLLLIITYGQSRREKTQICISLMDKRIELYYYFEEFFLKLPENSKDPNFRINDFLYHTKEVSFLFDKDISFLKEEIIGFANKIILNRKNLKNYLEGSELYFKEIDIEYNLMEIHNQWLSTDKIFKSFSPYIDFRKYRLPKKK